MAICRNQIYQKLCNRRPWLENERSADGAKFQRVWAERFLPLNATPYAYEDGDGTVHFFYKKTENGKTKYLDEDGLGLELKIISGLIVPLPTKRITF